MPSYVNDASFSTTEEEEKNNIKLLLRQKAIKIIQKEELENLLKRSSFITDTRMLA